MEQRFVEEQLAAVFEKLGYRGVAKQIMKGRNVAGNVEFAVRMLHDKLGPAVNVETMEFIPQSKEGRRLEERFIELANILLRDAGLREISTAILEKLREEDRAFEERVRARRSGN